ncbi:lysophospholipase [Cytidiella melzeri]|nr:lysophospholipase [Cytidiella melzeri]
MPSPPVAGKDYVESWVAGVDGHRFYTRTYAATFPTAIVLFVHGFAEHVGRYEHVHVKYPARGITVFSFDLRGYGRTALDAANKANGGGYGKTSWKVQMQDIEFFGRYLEKEYHGVPLFLMGHSAGGGQALAYFTRPTAPPSPEATKLFKAVICSSPCITLTNPKPRIIRWIGGKLALVTPYLLIPADVGVENLSRNPVANEASAKDPLIKSRGSLRGLDDMLTGGENLLAEDYKRWPKDLPILFIHGTGDRITSHKATEEFYNKINCTDKKLSLYDGAYHEIVHEVDGLSERLFDDCVSWIEGHLPIKQQQQQQQQQQHKTTSSSPPAPDAQTAKL